MTKIKKPKSHSLSLGRTKTKLINNNGKNNTSSSYSNQLSSFRRSFVVTERREKIEREKRMREIENKKCLIVYPDQIIKTYWDILFFIILVFTCISMPYRIAFVETDTFSWEILNAIIDVFFGIDIILTFNSAYYNDNFILIDDRKTITRDYIKSWFLIDLIAIVPFDKILIGTGGDFNDMVRLARMGRLYKLVKLIKLLRFFKLMK